MMVYDGTSPNGSVRSQGGNKIHGKGKPAGGGAAGAMFIGGCAVPCGRRRSAPVVRYVTFSPGLDGRRLLKQMPVTHG